MKCKLCNSKMTEGEMKTNNNSITIECKNKTYCGFVYVCENCGHMILDLNYYTEH